MYFRIHNFFLSILELRVKELILENELDFFQYGFISQNTFEWRNDHLLNGLVPYFFKLCGVRITIN